MLKESLCFLWYWKCEGVLLLVVRMFISKLAGVLCANKVVAIPGPGNGIYKY